MKKSRKSLGLTNEETSKAAEDHDSAADATSHAVEAVAGALADDHNASDDAKTHAQKAVQKDDANTAHLKDVKAVADTAENAQKAADNDDLASQKDNSGREINSCNLLPARLTQYIFAHP